VQSNVREKKSSSQYKGEREKEPQAELRPRKSSFFDDIPDEQELQFVHDENGTMRPMRGTLAKLVQLLAHEQGRGTCCVCDSAVCAAMCADSLLLCACVRV
jgi:hypothetical protein